MKHPEFRSTLGGCIRRLLPLSIVLALLLAALPAQAAGADTALPVSDLSVTRTRGAVKTTDCRRFTEIYMIKNNGPDTAEHVMIMVWGTDQFDTVSVNGVSGSQAGPFTLAAGQSMQVKAVLKVTAFGIGESRDGRVSAQVSMDSWPVLAIDPNADNDYTESNVWLQGQPRSSCP